MRLCINFDNLTVIDVVEVKLNGKTLICDNPMVPGAYDPMPSAWQNYDLSENLPLCGDNEISIRMAERNPRLADEIPVEVGDVELEVEYGYPNGPWIEPPGFIPRT